ncbi:5959_t:CDS:2, partial [Scutellospora calospora]
MTFSEGERAGLSETVPETGLIANESTPLLTNIETSNRPIIKSPWYKTASSYWLLPSFFVITFIFGLTLTTKVEFYLQTVCQHYYDSKENHPSINLVDINNNDVCNIPEIHAITSQLMMVLSLCLSVPGIFVLVPLGALSDRRGRRFVFLLAIAGLIIFNLAIILVGHFSESLGLIVLIIGVLIDGFLGGFSSLAAVLYSYAADCTVPEQRRVIFGFMQGALYLGLSLGTMVGGEIVEFTNNLLSVFYVSITISILFFLFVLFILPESLSKERQLDNQRRQLANNQENGNLNMLQKILNIFTPLSIFLSNPPRNDGSLRDIRNIDTFPAINARKYSLLSAAGIGLMIWLAFSGIQSIFLLYVRYKFEWSLVEQGYLISVTSATRVITLLFLFPIFIKVFKKKHDKAGNQNDGNMLVEDDVIVQNEKCLTKELMFDVWIVRIGLAIDIVAY